MNPTIVRIGAVKPDILTITVSAGRVIHHTQVPYEPQAGDRCSNPYPGFGWVTRDDVTIGTRIGERGDILYPLDTYEGSDLEPEWYDDPASYTVSGTNPIRVHRKSKPTDLARVGGWEFKASVEHTVYLVLAEPMVPGLVYDIAFADDRLPARHFVWRPEHTVSEAIHATQIGFRPDDPVKTAFLSCWMGTGGGMGYGETGTFRLLDDATGSCAFEGPIRLSRAAGEAEDPLGRNYNGTDVYEMDFSDFREPGTYRVFVEGVGCSHPIRIDADAWRDAARIAARGFYHQRNGIELGPPYTDFERPRCFHPADGVRVYASTCSLMDSGNGLNAKGTDKDNFGNLVAGTTDVEVEDAWGGYFDAGDWDRRIQHLESTRLMLELVELFPEYMAGFGLNIPESGNGLPDMVNESLWNIDCYRRMQTPEGGIRGGIESTEHPNHGEGSWQNSLTNLAYAPDPWSGFIYAGVAARAAGILMGYKPDMAKAYRDSALRAMAWSEMELTRLTENGDPVPETVHDERNLAAAELYKLTGDEGWNRLFLETTAHAGAGRAGAQQHAAFVYARTGHPGTDAGVKENCRNAIIADANASLELGERTAFHWSKPFPGHPLIIIAGPPHAVSTLRAHYLTGEEGYLRAAVLATQLGAGANPHNTTYTTGVGCKAPEHPLWIDNLILGKPVPPGLTVYGPIDPVTFKDDMGYGLVRPFTCPDPLEWPAMEAFFDVFWFIIVNEFTTHQTLGFTNYAWGYLAARQ